MPRRPRTQSSCVDRTVRRLERLTYLTHGAGKRGYQADQVYFCSELSPLGGTDCRSGLTGADDTAHTLEFPHLELLADPQLPFAFVPACRPCSSRLTDRSRHAAPTPAMTTAVFTRRSKSRS